MMPKDAATRDVSLADRLRPLLREGNPRIRLDEMVARIEGREGLAPILFVLTLPEMLPLPPGLSMVMAIPILLVAPQLMANRRRLWLPDWLARRTVKHSDLAKLLKRVLPVLDRVEKLSRPRFAVLTGPVGAFDIGLACTVIGFILATPLPFANLLPSWSLCAFSLGLTRRDGLLVAIGYGLLAAALAVIGLAVLGVDLGLRQLLALV
jgi:hypothetical protein